MKHFRKGREIMKVCIAISTMMRSTGTNSDTLCLHLFLHSLDTRLDACDLGWRHNSDTLKLPPYKTSFDRGDASAAGSSRADSTKIML